MNSKKWKRHAWILAVAVVLVFVVNPELRALVLLIDVLSLEVFLLFAGLQVKGIWLFLQPAIAKALKRLARLSAVGSQHFCTIINALNPRVPLALLTQQTLLAARIQLSAGRGHACNSQT